MTRSTMREPQWWRLRERPRRCDDNREDLTFFSSLLLSVGFGDLDDMAAMEDQLRYQLL